MAVDGAAARRRRRPRRRHPVAARRSGRPRATSRTSPTRSSTAATARSASASTSSTTPTRARTAATQGHLHRGPPVQPHVQDPRRAGRGRRRRGLPAARDGAGHVRQLHERARRPAARSRRSASPRSASRSATRSRPATSCSAPASSSRWRWSTSCRPTRRRSGTSTGATSGIDWYVDLGMPEPTTCGCGPTTPTSCSHYSSGTSDVEFLFPWGWDELEGIANRGDYDLTQHAKHSGEKLEYFDQATQRALRAPRHRAGRRRHPHDDGVPHGRLRRGGGRRRDRAPCCASTPASRPTRWRCCRCRRRTSSPAAGPRGARRSLAAALHVRLRRDPGHRPPLPPPGRARHAATASPSTSTRSRTRPSPSASATRWSRSGCRSTASSTTCATARLLAGA